MKMPYQLLVVFLLVSVHGAFGYALDISRTHLFQKIGGPFFADLNKKTDLIVRVDEISAQDVDDWGRYAEFIVRVKLIEDNLVLRSVDSRMFYIKNGKSAQYVNDWITISLEGLKLSDKADVAIELIEDSFSENIMRTKRTLLSKIPTRNLLTLKIDGSSENITEIDRSTVNRFASVSIKILGTPDRYPLVPEKTLPHWMQEWWATEGKDMDLWNFEVQNSVKFFNSYPEFKAWKDITLDEEQAEYVRTSLENIIRKELVMLAEQTKVAALATGMTHRKFREVLSFFKLIPFAADQDPQFAVGNAIPEMGKAWLVAEWNSLKSGNYEERLHDYFLEIYQQQKMEKPQTTDLSDRVKEYFKREKK